MRYCLYASIPHFYIRAHPSEQEQLLVIHRDKVVLDASLASQCRGIAAEMGLTEAKAMLGGDGIYLAWNPEKYAKLQTEWLDLCTEASSIIEPEHQHTAWLDLSTQADPYFVASELAKSLDSSGYQYRFGLARSKWLAKLSAETHTAQNKLEWELAMQECVHDPAHFLAAYPVESLVPAQPEERRRLRFLGYNTIGQAAALPRELLQKQFGVNGLTIYRACRGGPTGQISAEYPKDALQTQFTFPGGAENREQFDQGISALSKRLAKALKSRDAQAMEVEISLEYEDAQREELKRSFTKPLTSERTVLVALPLLLESVKKPVNKISVRLPNLAKVAQVQQPLSVRAQLVDPKGLDIAVNALHNVFGQSSVQRASQIAQTRRVRLLKLWQEATGWR